jgi:hypothetical protein
MGNFQETAFSPIMVREKAGFQEKDALIRISAFHKKSGR